MQEWGLLVTKYVWEKWTSSLCLNNKCLIFLYGPEYLNIILNELKSN